MKLHIMDELRYIGEPRSRFVPGEVYKIHSIDKKGVWVMPNTNNAHTTRVVFYHMEFAKHFEVVRTENELPVEPITLTKAQAAAVESAKTMFDFNTIIWEHAQNFDVDGDFVGTGWQGAQLTPLNEITVAQLATALLVGYKVELTSKEKALEEMSATITAKIAEAYDDITDEEREAKVKQIIQQIELVLDGEQNDSQ